MANGFKTPGVYVQEIATLPASVAQVPTAIPAFLGYVQKMPGESNQPVHVSSLAEFREKFGEGPRIKLTEIKLNSQNELAALPTPSQKFFLYDSIQLFYKNGGGDCYVVPLGVFDPEPTTSNESFAAGLKSLETEQDVTLIVMPDAVALEGNMFEAQQSALDHCKRMQNRFAIFDLAQSDHDGKSFRNKIGIDNTKFAAAYTPWLQASFPKSIRFRDVHNNIEKSGVKFELADEQTLQPILHAIDNADELSQDDLGETKEKFNKLQNQFIETATAETHRPMFDKALVIAQRIDVLAGSSTPLTGDENSLLRKQVATVAAGVKQPITDLMTKGKEIGLIEDVPSDGNDSMFSSTALAELGFKLKAEPVSTTSETSVLKGSAAVITNAFGLLLDAIGELQQAAAQQERTLDDALRDSLPIYRNLQEQLSRTLNVIPPSGAIAGIYARVDNDRGVWKAPANVNVTGIVGLSQTIDDHAQESLNVDVNAGLSINAIRAFSGRGILVWGARTLAGLDNEWRYVPVRRLFIMVEESIRRSTNWVVFEPNDANTWIKVKAMIENYLIGLWRQGALAGATPEQAFFVNVGLGSSMTPQDILEGRMIIEVGMAAVRPAEFVILRFSHKLQES